MVATDGVSGGQSENRTKSIDEVLDQDVLMSGDGPETLHGRDVDGNDRSSTGLRRATDLEKQEQSGLRQWEKILQSGVPEEKPQHRYQ